MKMMQNERDIALGARIRIRRKELGLSQQNLGARLGISFQQIQKYEKGTNRIAASRIYDLVEALGVPVTYFLQGSSKKDALRAGPPEALDLLNMPRALDLLRDFAKIEDAAVRNSLCNLAKALAKARSYDQT